MDCLLFLLRRFQRSANSRRASIRERWGCSSLTVNLPLIFYGTNIKFLQNPVPLFTVIRVPVPQLLIFILNGWMYLWDFPGTGIYSTGSGTKIRRIPCSKYSTEWSGEKVWHPPPPSRLWAGSKRQPIQNAFWNQVQLSILPVSLIFAPPYGRTCCWKIYTVISSLPLKKP